MGRPANDDTRTRIEVPSKFKSSVAAGCLWVRESDFPHLCPGAVVDLVSSRGSHFSSVRLVEVEPFVDLTPVGRGRHGEDRYLRLTVEGVEHES